MLRDLKKKKIIARRSENTQVLWVPVFCSQGCEKHFVQGQKLRLSVLSEGCQQLQKCGRGEEVSWCQLKEGAAVI